MDKPSPKQISDALRRVATAIEKSEDPSPVKVAYTLAEILTNLKVVQEPVEEVVPPDEFSFS